MTTREHLFAVLSGGDRSVRGALLRTGLACVEPAYAAVAIARNALFDLGLRRSERLPRPVISIGNLTTGGVGKTPIVQDLTRRLLAMGHKPAVLLRGYAPASSEAPDNNPQHASDEARLYTQTFGASVPLGVGADRNAAATRVLRDHPQVTVLLLDDGFQRRQTARDLDLVLIDASSPFGFGHMLPRGLLREPIRSLRRADAVILTHAEQVDARRLAELDQTIQAITGQPPLAHAAHRWTDFRDAGDKDHAIESLLDQAVAGFCAIGQPQAFDDQLTAAVGRVVAFRALPDHHSYADIDPIQQFIDQALQAGAQAVVTTEKDWVKLRHRLDWTAQPVPIYRPVLKIVYTKGEAELMDRLSEFRKQG